MRPHLTLRLLTFDTSLLAMAADAPDPDDHPVYELWRRAQLRVHLSKAASASAAPASEGVQKTYASPPACHATRAGRVLIGLITQTVQLIRLIIQTALC